VTLDATGCTGTLQWYVAASGGSPIATGSPFVTPFLNNTTTYYVSCLSAAGCEGPRSAVVATIRPVDPGSIAADQTICSGGDPALLTSIQDASGGGGVSITYQWELSINNGVIWTPIAGATGNTYNPPPPLTQTTWYRRVATGTKNGSGGFTCSVPSNVVVVTVIPLPVVTAPASVCVGSTATLSPTSGGTWTSSNPAVATVTNAGVITGVSAGTVTFTFTQTSTGCSNTTSSVTIRPKPGPITITHN
jgi:hypothetical protein